MTLIEQGKRNDPVVMGGSAEHSKIPVFSKRILTIVGGYGSGKSEVAVNLARQLAENQPEPVAIVDLDIVNPYFRSREAAARLEELGIRAINPKGSQFYAELPIILPEIKGAIQQHDGFVVLDVGGDDVGARVLSSFADAFDDIEYELFLVLNAYRPFTSTVETAMKVIKEIEESSRLKFTGIISNTHLLENTTVENVYEGYELARKVSEKLGVPIVFVSALRDIAQKIDNKMIDIPVLPLHRYLLKPWEREEVNGKKH